MMNEPFGPAGEGSPSEEPSTTASEAGSASLDTASVEETTQPSEAGDIDRELLRASFHSGFLPQKLRDELWEYSLSRQPYLVQYRGHDLKTRPKINYADPNEAGEYPLYRWGQERRSYELIEAVPPPVRAVMDLIEQSFNVRVNRALATYFWNGKDYYIPAHQDKRVTVASGDSRVETASRIFNVSLGAVRPFVITALDCLGAYGRENLKHRGRIPYEPR